MQSAGGKEVFFAKPAFPKYGLVCRMGCLGDLKQCVMQETFRVCAICCTLFFLLNLYAVIWVKEVLLKIYSSSL